MTDERPKPEVVEHITSIKKKGTVDLQAYRFMDR